MLAVRRCTWPMRVPAGSGRSARAIGSTEASLMRAAWQCWRATPVNGLDAPGKGMHVSKLRTVLALTLAGALVFAATAFAKNIVGSGAAERLTGTAGPDVINGLGGRDTIRGLAGDDVLTGDTGPDEVFGGPGNDNMNGGSGDDRLI